MKSIAWMSMALLVAMGCSSSDGPGSGNGASSGVGGVASSDGSAIPGVGGMAGAGGDAGGASGSRGAQAVCLDVCSWPSSCLDEFAPTLEGADCIEACEASVVIVGIECFEAINATVVCLGTCNEEELTAADIERCDPIAAAIETTCG